MISFEEEDRFVGGSDLEENCSGVGDVFGFSFFYVYFIKVVSYFLSFISVGFRGVRFREILVDEVE